MDKMIDNLEGLRCGRASFIISESIKPLERSLNLILS
jgi:hypothetical protein